MSQLPGGSKVIICQHAEGGIWRTWAMGIYRDVARGVFIPVCIYR